MTPFGRTVLGAAIGGTIALVAHPASRPYFVGVLDNTSPERLRSYVPDLAQSLPLPKNLDEAALWLRVGAAKSLNGGIKAPEVETLRMLAAQAASKDPVNAFWPQMQAFFASQANRPDEATREWRFSATSSVWNDHQNAALQRAARAFGNVQAQSWPFAFLTTCRNHASPIVTERYARSRLTGADLSSKQGVTTRLEVIRNGDLIRKGAKTLMDGGVGSKLVDLAVYPPEMIGVSRPKRLYLGRGQLYQTMRAEGMGAMVSPLVRTFYENDAWSTIVAPEDAEIRFREMAAISSILAALPGAALFVAMAGFVAMFLGRATSAGPRLPLVGTLLVVAGLTGVAWISSQSWLGAGAVALCGGFVLFRPPRERAIEVTGLGPLFQFVVGMIALLAGLSATAWLVGRATPARAIEGSLSALPDWWIEPSSAGALAALFISLLGLIAPAYALVYRVPTSRVLALGVRWFGTFLFIGAWIAVIVGTPLVVTVDRTLQSSLSKILFNEPGYYLTDGE